ncbi:MAG: hypothetical protein ABFD07_04210 [Methanobacterium sp.]
MTRYRRRFEKSITAEQYFKQKNIPYIGIYEEYYSGDPLSVCNKCNLPKGDHGVLVSFLGGSRVTFTLCPGDYIIKEGLDTYPCKKDEFERDFVKI